MYIDVNSVEKKQQRVENKLVGHFINKYTFQKPKQQHHTSNTFDLVVRSGWLLIFVLASRPEMISLLRCPAINFSLLANDDGSDILFGAAVAFVKWLFKR